MIQTKKQEFAFSATKYVKGDHETARPLGDT